MILLVQFPHFKHFQKAIINDSCNTATGPKISLMNKYSLFIWQCIKKTTGDWKINYPSIALHLGCLLLIECMSPWLIAHHLDYSLARAIFILSFTANDPAWYIDFCCKNWSYNTCLPYVSFQLLWNYRLAVLKNSLL